MNLAIVKDVQKKTGVGTQQKRKEDSNPLGDTKFILPGVPAPKNVAKEKEPESVQKQSAEQEREQTQVTFKVNITQREVIAFYNEKLKPKEPEARKAIMAMTDLKDNELKFLPGKFFSSVNNLWEEFLSNPTHLLQALLLFLFFLLLVWLFLPLTSFLSSYVKALKEKAGLEVKMESTNEEEVGEEGEGQGGGGGGLGEGGELLEEEKEGEDEMAKKYVPFEYITEENLKRLLGVFRKEPPQVIALILSYVKPELVRAIYSELPIDLQVKVAAESSAVRQATENQVRMVDENIKAKIDFVVGGVDNLIKILEEVDYKIRDNILEYLMNHKPQLYEKVRASILLFEDIAQFPDVAVQTILRELKTDQLARALRNSSPEITQKIFSNMSQGGAALLKEEMEYGRVAAEEQIEQERQNVVTKIKELEAGGKIHIRDKVKISVFESEDATSPLVPNLLDDEKPLEPSAPSASAFGGAGFPVAAAAEIPSEAVASAQELYNQGEYESAIQILTQAQQTEPQNPQVYEWLGHCYTATGSAQDALSYYEYALQLKPGDPNLETLISQHRQGVA